MPTTHVATNYLRMILNTELSKVPLSPRIIFSSVSLCNHPFSRYKIVGNRKSTEWTRNDLEHLTVKSTLYALNTYPQGTNFIRFTLQPAVLQIQGCRKSEKHRMTPNWWMHLNVKGPLWILNTYRQKPKFKPVSLYDDSFSSSFSYMTH